MKKCNRIEKHLMFRITMAIMLLCSLLILCSCTGEKKTQSEKPFDDEGIFVSEALSYEDLKKYYSQNKDVSLNDAEGKLAQMEITEEEGATYRVVTQKIEDNEKYTPSIDFYLKTSESKGTYTIEKIQNAEVYITMNQKSAAFLGVFAFWQRENNQIEYSLNGESFEAEAIEETVVIEKEILEDGGVQFNYTTKGEIQGKGEYIYIHKTI